MQNGHRYRLAQPNRTVKRKKLVVEMDINLGSFKLGVLYSVQTNRKEPGYG